MMARLIPNKLKAYYKGGHACMSDQRGVTATEYGLIAALIAVAAITSLAVLGPKLSAIFTKVAAAL